VLKEAGNGVSSRTARNSSGIEPSSWNLKFFCQKIEKSIFEIGFFWGQISKTFLENSASGGAGLLKADQQTLGAHTLFWSPVIALQFLRYIVVCLRADPG
jgi:hypothetical protein